jgi:hypothetical protein
MTTFSDYVVSQLIEIPICASRGRREVIFPFRLRRTDLTHALRGAERAYLKACVSTDRIDKLDDDLNVAFDEERGFFLKCEELLKHWDNMSEMARSHIAEVANYESCIKQYGDDEELLAVRDRLPDQQMTEDLRNTLAAITKAASAHARIGYVVPSGKKKDRVKDRRYGPLRAFCSELKCYWDRALEQDHGTEFRRKFAFSVACPFVFAAIKTLPSRYSEMEVRRIIRSLQAKSYNPKQFREEIPSDFLPKILAPGIARFLK